MRIDCERLWLRPFESSDLEAMHAMWRLPAVREYLWDDVEIDRATAEDVFEANEGWFRELGYGLFCVHLRAGDSLAGFCGLRPFEDTDGQTKPELLYGLHPDYWRRGYADEASRAVLRFGFDECGLDPIHAGIDPPNARSRVVLERLGFHDWRSIEIEGLPADYALITRADFEARIA